MINDKKNLHKEREEPVAQEEGEEEEEEGLLCWPAERVLCHLHYCRSQQEGSQMVVSSDHHVTLETKCS